MAAEGLGELVDVTSEAVLKPFVVPMTGVWPGQVDMYPCMQLASLCVQLHLPVCVPSPLKCQQNAGGKDAEASGLSAALPAQNVVQCNQNSLVHQPESCTSDTCRAVDPHHRRPVGVAGQSSHPGHPGRAHRQGRPGLETLRAAAADQLPKMPSRRGAASRLRMHV